MSYKENNEDNHNGGDKYEAGEISVGGRLVPWLENFWYYNKWKLIIGIFAVIVVGVCIAQSCRNASNDITIMYAGPVYLGTADMPAVRAAFSEAMPSDFNGDGEKNCDVAALNIYSAEQIKERLELAAADTRYTEINTYINSRELNSFDNLIAAGEYSVCLLDPWLYERIAEGVGLRKLADVLGAQPENAYDEYAVRFWDTAFAIAHSEALAAIPADTLLLLRGPISFGAVFSGNRNSQAYRNSEEMFRAIINYLPAED